MYFDDRPKRVGDLLYTSRGRILMTYRLARQRLIVFYNYVMYNVIVRTGHFLLPVLCIPYQRVGIDYPCRDGTDMPDKAFSDITIITGMIYTAQLSDTYNMKTPVFSLPGLECLYATTQESYCVTSSLMILYDRALE